MNYKDARALANEIRASGIASWVPTGQRPGCYFARIVTVRNRYAVIDWSKPPRELDFFGRPAWEGWRAKCLKADRKQTIAEAWARRSPIDVLIDRAVGRTR